LFWNYSDFKLYWYKRGLKVTTLLNTIDHVFARKVCTAHQDRPDELLEILHEIQEVEGFLSDRALRTISKSLNLSRAEVHGVVSFYHDFKREKQAESVIKICRAEACQAVDVDKLIVDLEIYYGVKMDNGGDKVSLESIFCLGNCALGPAVLYNNDLYGRVSLKAVQKMIDTTKEVKVP
jgi:formate dehydrogenase subunit gamma